MHWLPDSTSTQLVSIEKPRSKYRLFFYLFFFFRLGVLFLLLLLSTCISYLRSSCAFFLGVWGWFLVGYGSFYGKKFDPEPGRCRRTDGKKWRCSKDAHPESKYCERHMHRGRNRSRKPVEMPTSLSQQQQSPSPSPSSSSTVTSLTAVGSNAVAGGSSGGGSINIVGNRGSAGNGGGMGPYYNNSTSVATTTHGGFFSGQIDSGSYLAMGNTNNNNKSYR